MVAARQVGEGPRRGRRAASVATARRRRRGRGAGRKRATSPGAGALRPAEPSRAEPRAAAPRAAAPACVSPAHAESGLTRAAPLQSQGHLAVVRELLADAGRRSCLKSLSKDGSTALHIATAAGQAEAVQLLLDAGARTDARDRVSLPEGGGGWALVALCQGNPARGRGCACWPCPSQASRMARRSLPPGRAGRPHAPGCVPCVPARAGAPPAAWTHARRRAQPQHPRPPQDRGRRCWQEPGPGLQPGKRSQGAHRRQPPAFGALDGLVAGGPPSCAAG
jgi:hypothetical protein